MMTKYSLGSSLPFLLLFGERIPERQTALLRYDARQSISQVFSGGEWVDALDMKAEMTGLTKLTEVRKETTDDE